MGIESLMAFFGKWYVRQNLTAVPATVMLWPCWQFDHAKGFLRFSRQAIYEATGYIMPKNPTFHENLHLPVRIIQQLNLARGRIRSNLSRYLTVSKKQLLILDADRRCPCACARQIEFETRLQKRHIWPLNHHASLNDAISAMDPGKVFGYSPDLCAHDGYANWNPDFNEIVRVACKKTKNYFEGLCLDCMSKRPLDDNNRDFRAYEQFHDHIMRPINLSALGKLRREPGRRYDKFCRVQHTQPTWYFSLLARREEPVRLRGEENDADSLASGYDGASAGEDGDDGEYDADDTESDADAEWDDAMETIH